MTRVTVPRPRPRGTVPLLWLLPKNSLLDNDCVLSEQRGHDRFCAESGLDVKQNARENGYNLAVSTSPFPDSVPDFAALINPSRLAALDQYAIMGTEPEPAFDDIARLASWLCEVPSAFVTFVDDQQQFLKAATDENIARQTLVSSGFCPVTVAKGEALVIPDTLTSPAYAENPVVKQAPFLRAYAGVPVCSPHGYVLGAVCVVDTKPRPFPDTQIEALRVLGRQVESLLALRRFEQEQDTRLSHARKAETVLDTISDAVITLSADWRIVYANNEAARLNQKPAEEFVGRTNFEEWPATVGTDFERYLRRAMTERVVVRFEERYFERGVFDLWLQVTAYPDEIGGGLHVVYRDITHEKQRRAAQIIDAGLVGILNFTLAGGVTEANDRFLHIVGYNRDDLKEKRVDWAAMTPPELHARDEEALRELAQTGKHEPFEKEYVRKDGTRVPVIVGATLFPNSQTEGVAFVLDLTDQKRAEREREVLLTEQQRLVAELREAGARQRRFLKEMLAGFTDGRLRLCTGPSELPIPLTPLGETVTLLPASLRTLRKQVEAAAEKLELPFERLVDFETAAHEAGMNAVKYGGGGVAQVCGDANASTLQVWIEDQGPGIADDLIHRAIERGFTTGGFGHGMFLMRSCADRFYLLTTPQGTTVVLEIDRTPPLPAWLK